VSHELEQEEYTMTNGERYPCIVAWGAFIHSEPHYVEDQLIDAVFDSAPGQAVYRDKRGQWVELPDLTAPGIKQFFRDNYPDLAYQAWGEA
jgi:hypothetical protein